MLLKALDFIRIIGWGIIDFIYNLIDVVLDVLYSLNAFNIIDSISNNSIFSKYHSGVIAISVTLLGLFAIWRFVMKILEPDEGLSISQIVMEILKCSLLVLLSTFLFAEVSKFSISLSNYTSSIFSSNNLTLSSSILTMYVDYSAGYKESDEFSNENISTNVSSGIFTGKRMFNDKYITSSKWILPDEQDYKYSINWIMAILIGGFFLYSLFFCGMMLAKRQIEFLFLFVISPIIFATSIGNKQRRSAVIEQLVSLMLQGVVVMLIICLTALVMQQINETIFFDDVIKDILVKSLMYFGCATFLLTGSQVVNRFIGNNISVNSGRDYMMSLFSFGSTLSNVTSTGAMATSGGALMGIGATLKGISKTGVAGDIALSKIGKGISSFGSKISNQNNNDKVNNTNGIGNKLQTLGNYLDATAITRQNPVDSTGVNIPSNTTKLNRLGAKMINIGSANVSSALDQVLPSQSRYRKRYGTGSDN